MTDIVERLREWDHEARGCECHEAADEIERLRAEVEKLKQRNVELRSANGFLAIETDNARLREALTAIRDSTYRNAVTLRGMAAAAIDAARKA